MIGFYLTTNGSWKPGDIEDLTNSFIMDDKNKKLTVMGEYDFEFQKLSGTYETASADASSLALSIYGANKMYTAISGRLPLDASIEQWNAAKPGTVTSVTAGTGLTGGSITDSGTIALAESGATAGTYGLSADASVNLNDSPLEVAIPNITVDAYGRVTSISTNKLKVANTDTIPAAGNYSELNTGTSETSKTWDASTISKFVKEQSGSSYDKGTIAQLNAGTDESPQVWDASTIANYVRTSTELGIRYRDDFDASTGVVGSGPDTLTSLAEKKGDMFIVSSEGTYLNRELQVGDAIIFKKASSAGDPPIAGNLSFVQGVVKVVDGNATLEWNTPVVVGTVEGVQLHVSLPAMPSKADLGLENVENKSSETIRSEITAANVSTALGYIPANANTLDDYVADASVETSLTDTDDKIPTSKAIKNFVEGKGYGTVTSVGVTVPTGLSVSNTPITTDGSIAIAMSDGYKIPLDASLDAFQDAVSKAHTHSNSGILAGLTDSSISNWNTASSNSHTHDNKSVLDGISSTDIENWDDASSKKHTHSNIGILNSLSDTSVEQWNGAVAAEHTHSNAGILNNLSDTSVSNWNDAYADKHTHTNSGILDGITDASIEAWSNGGADAHTHANKAVLDGISADDVTNWIDASTKKHTHSNSGILNGLTDSSISNWNTASANSHTHSNAGILNGLVDASIQQWNAAKDGTVTSITVGTGLTGGTITTTGTIALDESGATEGRYGQTDDASVNKNGSVVTVNIPDISVDAYGRVTSISNKTLKVANDDTTYDAGTLAELNTGTEIIAKLWDASTIAQFVNASAANGVKYKGDVNATTGDIVGTDKTLTTASEKKGDMYVITTAGTIADHELQIGDAIIFKSNVAAGTAPVEENLSFVQGTVKVVDKNATLAYDTSTEIAEVEGVKIHVKMPAMPSKSELGLGNVENKSSETIRGEITATNVSTALGYIPADADDLGDYVADASVETTLTDSDDKIATSKAVKNFVEGKGYTTNTGTVTSVGITVPTGLSVSSSPISTDGSIAIAMATGYAIPLDASLDNFQAAATASHTHSNKSVLDGISSDDVTNWTDASNAKHSHSNKAVLDGISADDVANWIDASNAKHTHVNAGIVNGLTDTSISHWDTAYTNSHSHNNADILNGFTDSSIEQWNAARPGTVTSVGLTVPTGLTVSGSPITTDGSIAVALDAGYAIPLDASLKDFQDAYLWGDHAEAGYALATVMADVSAYAIDLSTNINDRADDISSLLTTTNASLGVVETRVTNVSTYAINVSTYSNDVSTRLAATNSSVNTKFGTLDASMQQIFNHFYEQSSTFASSWNNLYTKNPSIVR